MSPHPVIKYPSIWCSVSRFTTSAPMWQSLGTTKLIIICHPSDTQHTARWQYFSSTFGQDDIQQMLEPYSSCIGLGKTLTSAVSLCSTDKSAGSAPSRIRAWQPSRRLASKHKHLAVSALVVLWAELPWRKASLFFKSYCCCVHIASKDAQLRISLSQLGILLLPVRVAVSHPKISRSQTRIYIPRQRILVLQSGTLGPQLSFFVPNRASLS